MSKIFFITGVCGVGKSSIIPFLKSGLSEEIFDIRDFDERGVPSGADRQWRLNELQYWLKVGHENVQKGFSTIICGFSKPDEIISNESADVSICLLDASSGVIRDRLSGRYMTKESQKEIERVSGDAADKFIEDNVKYSEEIRRECESHRCHIINTDNLDVNIVADKIIEWVKVELRE